MKTFDEIQGHLSPASWPLAGPDALGEDAADLSTATPEIAH
jgi:hypothetical protein